MKKFAIALLSTSILVTNTCLATPLNRFVVAEHCRVVSNDLSRLAGQEEMTSCADLVKDSALYIDRACTDLWQNNLTDALAQVNTGIRHLIGMSSSKSCIPLARQTTPLLMTAMQLENEIKAIT